MGAQLEYPEEIDATMLDVLFDPDLRELRLGFTAHRFTDEEQRVTLLIPHEEAMDAARQITLQIEAYLTESDPALHSDHD